MTENPSADFLVPYTAALMGSITGSCLMLIATLLLMPSARETVSEYMRKLAKKRWKR